MCQHGNTTRMEVIVPEYISHTKKDRMAIKHIDSCIAPAIAALNAAGLTTVESCCGHGNTDGYIQFDNGGRWLLPMVEGGDPVRPMRAADSIMRWLDGGYYVLMFKGEMNSYVSVLVKREELSFDPESCIAEIDEARITDGMSPTQSLELLAQKPLEGD